MWLGAIFTSTAAVFGRLFLVGLLPNAIFAAYLWILIASGAFHAATSPLSLAALAGPAFKTDAGGLLLFALVVMLATALLQPLQIRMVRIVEGYWQGGRWSSGAYKVGVRRHGRRYAKMVRRLGAGPPPDDDALCRRPVADQIRDQRAHRRAQARAARARAALFMYPPEGKDLLPTMLGNVLRRHEAIAGDRYQLTAVHVWPHLYPHLSDRLAAEYHAATDALDSSVNLLLTLTLMSVFGMVALRDDEWLLVIPAILAGLAFTAYRSAIASAQGQGRLLAVAFDQHRFDMIRSMHLELPATPAAEAQRNHFLSDYLVDLAMAREPRTAADALLGMTYRHDE